MLEVILVAGIVAVAAVLMYGVVGSLYKSWVTEGIKADTRQNARMALETVTKDLEMAGFQTTMYGDANKANLQVTLAAADEIEFDQQRLNIENGSYEPRMTYYHLATDAATGRQNLYRQIRIQPGLSSPDEIIAENISSFTVTYFDADGAAVAGIPAAYTFGNAPPQALRDIRRVCVALTAGAERAAPTVSGPSAMTLSTCVMPRNFTVEETALDAEPPSTPTGLTAADTGSCSNKLCLRWNRNPETDLAGYVVYYDAGSRTVPLSSLADPANPRIFLNPGDLLVTKHADRVTSPTVYNLSIAAFDSSGNHSPASGSVSGPGNPADDERDCTGGTGPDTTVNPLKPSPPENMTVVPGGENELVISWSPPADGSATVGYRLYRSDEQFPDGVPVDPSFLVADETVLTTGVTTFTDPGLVGCQTYFYAVASINCDETLVPFFYVFDKNPGQGDYAKASEDPLDLTPPPPTSIAGTRAGFQRIFLDFANPLADEVEDFNRTEIFYKQSSQCPVIQPGEGNVAEGFLIPDSDSGTPGTFVTPGNQTVIFDDHDVAVPPTPSLTNQAQYCLLSVAYDNCDNIAVDSTSLILVDLCGDDPVGPPPEWPINPTYSSCSPEWVKLTWDYPPKDYTGAASIYDFAGFRIWRTGPEPGTVLQLTDGPTWNESWSDGRDLQEGGQYRYEVRATDCVYENDHVSFPNNYSTALFIPSDTTWISPGRLTLFQGFSAAPYAEENFVSTLSDASQPFTHHNNVRFFVQNTSRATMTMETMTVFWDNPNVLLQSVTVGGPPSTTAVNARPTGGVPSGTPVSLNVTVNDTATGLNQPSGPVPVVLRFTTTDGSVNRFADMRGQEMIVSLQSRNNSLQQSTCDPENFVLSVPQGPSLGRFVQDWPAPSGSPCYEVIGQSGTARDDDVKIPALVEVNVSGLAFDNSGPLFGGTNQGFHSLSLFVAQGSPTPEGQAPSMPAAGSYTEIPLQQVAGSQYALYDQFAGTGTKLPVADGQSSWYYIIGVDRTGNFDRFPPSDFGACAFYQKPPDPCGSRPKPPALSGTPSPSTVDLTWSVPTETVDGGYISPGETLYYDVYLSIDGAPFTSIATDLTTASHTHSGDITGATHAYRVTARNTCSTEVQESDFSNIFRECEGQSGISCDSFFLPATAGVEEPFSISARDICLYTLNGAPDSVTFRMGGGVENKDFDVEETGDTGTFVQSVVPTNCSNNPSTTMAADIGPAATTIPLVSTLCFPPSGEAKIEKEEIAYGGVDGNHLTGVVRGINGTKTGSHKAGKYVHALSEMEEWVRVQNADDPITVEFIAEGSVQCTGQVVLSSPCENVPLAPSPFSVEREASNTEAHLAWGAPAYNTDGSPALDLGGYEIEVTFCKIIDGTECDSWSPWETIDIPDPDVTSFTVTGLQSARSGFRMRAYDLCSPTKNYSAYTPVVRK